jgi:glycosyltransferase involved in cell wall biosynthesis
MPRSSGGAAPAVSILLPVHDALPYLGASLRSLWRQSFADFEVIAVDDGSSDGSGEALERAARRDPRLRVRRTPHQGLPLALAHALAQARAPLVARHDADDLSHPDRLALQIRAFRGAGDFQVLGTRLRLFPHGAAGEGMARYVRWQNSVLTHEEMAREALVESPLAHGTAMMRRDWLERAGGWSERGWAEDMDLWLRLLEAGARFAKLDRVLYAWRQHARSATRRDPRYSVDRMLALKLHHLERGLLARHAGRPVTLVGTGRSGERWREALHRRVEIRYRLARSPESWQASVRRDPLGAALEPPVVLVFMAPPRRTRWRRALETRRLVELRDFVFVA